MSEETETAKAPVARPWRLGLLAIVLAAGLATFYWVDLRQRLSGTQHELATRLRAAEEGARQASTAARAAQDSLHASQARIATLEARVAESQSQQLALEALYADLTRSRDEWQLAEIEQVLAIASQQLQLAGNVRAALLALQLAEARLARTDRPQFVPIKRALTRDIERLKALPAIDMAAMSARLDGLVAAVDALPLAFEERTERPAAAKGGAAPQDGF
jgi:uroporphyrin-3 C-methyltransferase